MAPWRPLLVGPAALGVLALRLLDRPYYRFVARRRGLAFAVAWFH